MSTGPTMDELARFAMEHLPHGYSLKVGFTSGEGTVVYLSDCARGVLETWANDTGDFPATVVRQVNIARKKAGLGPVEGPWDQI